jgi:hypothetical protein
MTTQPTPEEQAAAMVAGRAEAEALKSGGELRIPSSMMTEEERTRHLIRLGRDLEKVLKLNERLVKSMERIAATLEKLT